MKLLNFETMARGTDRQKKAYETLSHLQLFEKMKAYSPVLAGAVPLDIDTPASILHIICSASNLETFAKELENEFGHCDSFDLHHKLVRSQPGVVARFFSEGFVIEVCAQSASVFTQLPVIHMLIEARLLAFAPKEAREKIRALKATGVKTEDAFAATFDIQGVASDELAKIAMMADHEILMIAHRFRFMNP